MPHAACGIDFVPQFIIILELITLFSLQGGRGAKHFAVSWMVEKRGLLAYFSSWVHPPFIYRGITVSAFSAFRDGKRLTLSRRCEYGDTRMSGLLCHRIINSMTFSVAGFDLSLCILTHSNRLLPLVLGEFGPSWHWVYDASGRCSAKRHPNNLDRPLNVTVNAVHTWFVPWFGWLSHHRE